MVQSQYSLSWDSFRNNICSGFSSLQQNEEFVDMTLAADGHFVKVHQVLVALSSPYIKELIASAPCQHPVIFLNNVSHKTLCYLLEYIYTGEVLVPADNLGAFTEAAKALHIKGLENTVNISSQSNSKHMKTNTDYTPVNESELCHVSGFKRKAVTTSEGVSQLTLPAQARKIFIKSEGIPVVPNVTKDETSDFAIDMLDDSGAHDSDDGFRMDDTTITTTADATKLATSSNLQFTVSIRGSLQVILNRYIYNFHSLTTRTGVRRWRCVDYRNNKCGAFVVTKGNVVLNRANPHNHPFHDKKILAKIEKKAVFSALDDVEAYKEKEDRKNDSSDVTIEQDNFMSIETLTKGIDEKTNR